MAQQQPSNPQGPKIGLALGGGGAKGLAHIGVLKVLEENHIPIHCIAGTSVGALVGGAYAAGVPVDEMIRLARKIQWSDLGRVTISRLGFRDSTRMEEFLRKHLPVTTFDKVRIPLAVVATDICTGNPHVFTSGNLPRAIRASCAIPGYFTPVVDDEGRMFVDGGISVSLPVVPLKSLGAEWTIGVDVYPFSRLETPPTNLAQIYFQAVSIMGHSSANHWRQKTDLLIVPKLDGIGWDDLSRADEIIAAGVDAMQRALGACRRLSPKKRPGLFSRLRTAFSS
jgi:NTE family protein